MSLLPSTELERTSLEAHVDLCAMRYAQLDARLTAIEIKIIDLGKAFEDSRNGLSKVIITAAGTTIASILGLIITILMKF